MHKLIFIMYVFHTFHIDRFSTGSAEGGDWQAFAYNADAMVWTRLADMRYVLSR